MKIQNRGLRWLYWLAMLLMMAPCLYYGWFIGVEKLSPWLGSDGLDSLMRNNMIDPLAAGKYIGLGLGVILWMQLMILCGKLIKLLKFPKMPERDKYDFVSPADDENLPFRERWRPFRFAISLAALFLGLMTAYLAVDYVVYQLIGPQAAPYLLTAGDTTLTVKGIEDGQYIFSDGQQVPMRDFYGLGILSLFLLLISLTMLVIPVIQAICNAVFGVDKEPDAVAPAEAPAPEKAPEIETPPPSPEPEKVPVAKNEVDWSEVKKAWELFVMYVCKGQFISFSIRCKKAFFYDYLRTNRQHEIVAFISSTRNTTLSCGSELLFWEMNCWAVTDKLNIELQLHRWQRLAFPALLILSALIMMLMQSFVPFLAAIIGLTVYWGCTYKKVEATREKYKKFFKMIEDECRKGRAD